MQPHIKFLFRNYFDRDKHRKKPGSKINIFLKLNTGVKIGCLLRKKSLEKKNLKIKKNTKTNESKRETKNYKTQK